MAKATLRFCASLLVILPSTLPRLGASTMVKGTPGVVTARATVNVRELREHFTADDVEAESGERAPLPGPDNVPVPDPDGVITRGASVTVPVPQQSAKLSPAPAVTFDAFAGTARPPDTMGAVGPNHVVTVVNGDMLIQSRTGAVIKTLSRDSFWSPLERLYGAVLYPFDPRMLYDRFTGRFIYVTSANPSPDITKILLAVSATNDPTGVWTEYGFDVDPTKVLWADYPSIGFNANWITIQMNMGKYGANDVGVFDHIELYAFNKSQALAGAATVSFTKFVGVLTPSVKPDEIGGGTWATAIDADNASPNVIYFVQSWNARSGQIRVSRLSGPVGSETLTAGTQFPRSPDSWTNQPPNIGHGWSPQSDDLHTKTDATHVSALDGRMQNAVLRGGSLWCTQAVSFPTTHQPAGTDANSPAHPTNHAALQWWQIDPSINTGAVTSPIQRGVIEDPTAKNCFNGDTTAPAQIVSCADSGTFYAYPSIAVNATKDVLIGFSLFSADDWAGAAYAYRDHADPANTIRKPVVFRSGRARYAALTQSLLGDSLGETRWGDFSAAMTDPVNDRDFWVIQEYSERRGSTGPAADGVWGTQWAQVLAPTLKRRIAKSRP